MSTEWVSISKLTILISENGVLFCCWSLAMKHNYTLLRSLAVAIICIYSVLRQDIVITSAAVNII